MERFTDDSQSSEQGYLGSWREDGFVLHLFDTGRQDENFRFPKPIVRYVLTDEEFSPEPLFAADDLAVSPLYAPDSEQALADLIGFLSLEPGDTDDEFFAKYTDRQRQWLETARPSELKLIGFDLENPQPSYWDGPDSTGALEL